MLFVNLPLIQKIIPFNIFFQKKKDDLMTILYVNNISKPEKIKIIFKDIVMNFLR